MDEAAKIEVTSFLPGAFQQLRNENVLAAANRIGVDAKKSKSIVAIKPKPPFKPVFQVAASREGSDIRILNEPLNGSSLFLVETGEGRTPRLLETITSPAC